MTARLPHHLDLTALPDARWRPVGILAPLDAPPRVWLMRMILVVAIPAAGAFAAGWRLRVTGPFAAATLLVVTTYASSWGQLFHTENLLVAHVIVLAVAVSMGRSDPALVLRAMAVVTAAAYVVSGVAKLRNGGFDWITGDVLRNQVAFDNLRKVVIGASQSPFAATALRHAWLFPPLAAVTVAVELGAPLALIGRRAAVVWSVVAWLFHVGILALMAIGFPYQLSGIAFAPLLPVERLRLPGSASSDGRERPSSSLDTQVVGCRPGD
jgi:hypothetical protein